MAASCMKAFWAQLSWLSRCIAMNSGTKSNRAKANKDTTQPLSMRSASANLKKPWSKANSGGKEALSKLLNANA